MKTNWIVYFVVMVLCAMPFVDVPFALLAGIILTQFIEHPFRGHNKRVSHFLLQASVVGLGFGMNAIQAAQAGRQGLILTIFSISVTLALGLFLGRKLKVEKDTSFLISSGTAICGGSAIAAISGVIKANERQITTALSTVFILNSVALFLFPFIGHLLHLSQHQFGVWAAIAIHDTSSVVGAAAKYGTEALQIATTIKLERALWIIPVALLSVIVFKTGAKKIKIPYFIFLFVLVMLANTFIPNIHVVSPYAVAIAKIGLKLTLFLIGTSLTRELITATGLKPMLQGITLWFFISVISLVVVIYTIV